MPSDIPARYDDATLKSIASFWGVSFAKTCPQIPLEGSPERTLFRTVIEDDKACRFVLEQVSPSSFDIKMRIIRTLAYLSAKGLAKVVPYMPGPGEAPIQRHEKGCWQLVPFCEGIPLDRNAYLHEPWRAEALAKFLIDLREKARGIPFFGREEVFSITKYILVLAAQVQRREPEVSRPLGEVVAFLERGFMPVHDTLPAAFCHGDFHPLNIIWSRDDIQAVIDWEFCGIKPEIYDAANMVGCLGMEHPSTLTAPLVTVLVRRLRDAGIFAPVSWEHFLEFVVAIRFAWLSEWLRKDDREMIALELEYMDLLTAHRDDLRAAWGLSA